MLVLLLSLGNAFAQGYKTEKDIYYKDATADEYSKERCRLDVYYPEGSKGFKTLVWFHGGGLVEGSKDMPPLLRDKGICIVSVNYRLSPRAKAPAYIEDAAASVAWVFDNIAKYGGDPQQIYVGGHSAGGYLALMIALDKDYMAKYGADADKVKAYYPVSGQTATHYQIRAERGLPMDIPLVDEYAPLANIRKDTAPILFTSGQRELEMNCRTAENQYLYDALKSAGNENVEFHAISGFDHGTVMEPSQYLIMRHMGIK